MAPGGPSGEIAPSAAVTAAPRILVAGIGNIFFGDDGFGVEVARRLARAEIPDGVTVADYGISGMHLAYDLANGFETAILVDATPRGGAPGTIYVLEPEQQPDEAAGNDGQVHGNDGGPAPVMFDAHGMQPDVVLGMLAMLGGRAGRILIVGCEPASAEPGMGLSAPVATAVDEAVRVVLGLVGNDSGLRPRT
jgi:hydrogenase maturation protease